MKIIEVIGPSGSGKSTLCLSLQNHLNQSGTANIIVIGTKKYYGNNTEKNISLYSSSLFSKIYSYCPAFIETFNILPHLMEPYRKGTHLNNPRYFRMLSLAFKQASIQKQILRILPEESVAIFDPGCLMRLLNGYIYATHEPEVETLRKFFKKIILPSLLVVLNVDPKDSLDRLSARERGLPKRMRQLGKKNYAMVIRQGNKAASVIGREAEKNNVDTLFLNSTSLMPDELALAVMSRLREHGAKIR